MNYSALIGDSWRLVWRRKSLIGLAFLSTLASSLAYLAMYIGFVAAFFSSGFFSRLFLFSAADIGLPVNSALPFLAMILSAVLWLLLWLVSLSARGGLIAAVHEHERGQATTPGGAFGRGWRRVLTLAAMAFVLFLPVTLLSLIGQAIMLAVLPDFAMMNETDFMGQLMSVYALSLAFSCITYALMAFLQFIYAFAFRGVVLGEMGVVASIRHGWRVLRGHAGEIIPLAMIFGGLLVVLVVIGYIAFFGVYIVFIIALAAGGGDVSVVVLAVGAVVMLLFLLLTLVVGAILLAWRSTVFTIGYRHWIEGKPAAGGDGRATDFIEGTDGEV